MNTLSHLDEQGRARMVDVADKSVTLREALARGRVYMREETLRLISENRLEKGDVLGTARLAGIMAAKRTSELIPLCHPIDLSVVELQFFLSERGSFIELESRVKAWNRTGVEMEALTAVIVGALTIYDMCKAVDKEMLIGEVRLVSKSGGRSGEYRRPGEDSA